MLRSLHIRNYALIDSLDIKFPEGLVIITGQTGAGKSILLGALGLLAGQKAEAEVIGPGGDDCVVEGEFDTPEGLRIIRRVIYSSGRSRSFIDDCPVQIQELTDLSSGLFDIHSQHKSLLLNDKHFQLSLLDHYAGNKEALAECRRLWKEIGECRKELEDARGQLRTQKAELDYNEAQYKELESARLKDGELAGLEEEQQALANAEEIRERLATALQLFNPDGRQSIGESLREARKALDHAGKFLPSMTALGERIESARIELEDIFAEVEDAAGRTESSGERLEAVEDRLSLLYKLLRKHGCESIAELIEVRERFGRAVSGSEELEELCAELEKKLTSLKEAHLRVCDALDKARRQASVAFAAEVTGHLHYLELERSSFEVEVLPADPGASGSSSVAFKFSADGTRSVDVAKCASGGEISRIMLSLKALMAKFEGMPTLIFDEIDSGVSGSVADKMGSMICEMGRTIQVFSITHLPQVAAKGDAHYLVSKQFDEASGRTYSGIRLLEGEARVQEVARLLSGASITPEAVANARSLLKEAAL